MPFPPEQTLLIDSEHPLRDVDNWYKYRLTYSGGDQFINEFLEKFDLREDKDDFKKRLCLTYNPAFASEALNEMIGAFTQRMSEVVRTSPSESYTEAVRGKGPGVDLEGNSMDVFMEQKVLPELLPLGKVGLYLDRADFNPTATLAEFKKAPAPYLYVYRVEDIMSWNYCHFEGEMIFLSVLLRERRWVYNQYGLPQDEEEVYRFVRLLPDGAGTEVTFLREIPEHRGNPRTEEVIARYILPKMKRIPFILADIGKSLLRDIYRYQIALLNIASADLMYTIKGNFPFYVEGYDPKTENLYARTGNVTTFDPTTGEVVQTTQATADTVQEIQVGIAHGRKYPMEAKPPEFINPSTDPLKASMDKQEQLKSEIWRLLNLAVANVAPSRQSAESKKADQVGLESGLSRIGKELEAVEYEIAKLWLMYEGVEEKELAVAYPKTYSLKQDSQRVEEAKGLKELQGAAPSLTFAKEVAKEIVVKLFSGKVPSEILKRMMDEIDKADYMTSDAIEIAKDLEGGLVDAVTASTARGYDGKRVVPLAQKERSARLAESAAAQASQARGNPDGVPDADAEKKTSQDPDAQVDPGKATRGVAK